MKIFELFRPKIIADVDSVVNKKIRVVEKRGKKIIYVAGAEQSGGTITGMWQKAVSVINSSGVSPSDCLLLGLGGGDVIRILKKNYPDIVIAAVDLDPVMIKIARDYFDLGELSGVKTIKRDALYFMVLNRKKYDLIVVDLFIGFKNPEKFRSLRFLKLLANSLTPGGCILYNSHYHSEDDPEFRRFFDRCSRVFSNSEIIISYPYSRILALHP